MEAKEIFILGLTGKSAAGKNCVASFLEEWGWIHLDTDKIAHEILNDKARAVASLFGEEILTKENKIDRQRLGKLVFGNPERMGQLENLIYPILEEKIRLTIAAASDRMRFVINGANLQASPSLCRLCNAFLVIESFFLLRLFRAYRRDKRNLFQLIKRFSHQQTFSVQDFFPEADIQTITNNTTKRRFKYKIFRFVKKRNLIDGKSK